MPRLKSSRGAVSILGLLAACALAACGKGERVVDVGAGQPVIDPVPVAPVGISPAERLGAREEAPRIPRSSGLAWTAPGDWTELPSSPMREVGFRVGGSPDAECTLAVFPGDTGGLLANVNRWRTQLSLQPIDEAALAALPKKSLLGGDGALVELSGRYVGMDGSKSVGDAKLVGVIRALPAVSVFVKLVGPAKVVDGEAGRFDAFCASIRMGGAPAPTQDAPPPSAKAPVATGATGEAGGVRWKWPAGWKPASSGRPMRAATFAVEGAPGTDIALTVLPGDAGGLAANLNRWREQMGQPALEPAEIAALPRISSLGVKGVVVSIDGTYTSMQGERTEKATFLGAVIERESDVVFVKATGPASEVAKIRPTFDAFVASLEDGGK